jgi:hypothetical protein
VNTDTQSGTTIHEIEDGIYRISVPVPEADFSYNQFLIVDDEPLLFHTGLRSQFPLVSEAIRKVMPLERLRYVAFSHFESDECGALNLFLAAAPDAVPPRMRRREARQAAGGAQDAPFITQGFFYYPAQRLPERVAACRRGRPRMHGVHEHGDYRRAVAHEVEDGLGVRV